MKYYSALLAAVLFVTPKFVDASAINPTGCAVAVAQVNDSTYEVTEVVLDQQTDAPSELTVEWCQGNLQQADITIGSTFEVDALQAGDIAAVVNDAESFVLPVSSSAGSLGEDGTVYGGGLTYSFGTAYVTTNEESTKDTDVVTSEESSEEVEGGSDEELLQSLRAQLRDLLQRLVRMFRGGE